MAIKESSDELNPTVVASVAVSPATTARTASDYLAIALATSGVGYIPIAPGTFGSLVGIGLWVGLRGMFLAVLWPAAARNNLNLVHISYALIACLLIAAVVVTLVGTWAASRVEGFKARRIRTRW